MAQTARITLMLLLLLLPGLMPLQNMFANMGFDDANV